MYDPDSHEEEVRSATLRVRSKIAKGARGGYAVEQTIELACPISHWIAVGPNRFPCPVVVIGFTDAGKAVTKRYDDLYAAAMTQAGAALMDEVRRRQQAEGGLRITEDE